MFKPLQEELGKDRIFGLDILRCLAILMVMIEHGMLLLEPIFESLDFMKLGGYWGVELFFVLSGFLIGRILLRICEEEKFGGKALISFWKRRWYRTLPNYYLIFLFNLVILYASGSLDKPASWMYFFFVQNMFAPHPKFFGEAWSLAVEEWFYLIFPIIIYLLHQLKIKAWSHQYKFLLGIVILFLFSFLMKWDAALDSASYWDSGIRKLVPLRMDAILTGVLFAWFQYYYKEAFHHNKQRMLVLGLILLSFSFYGYYWDIQAEGISNTSFWGKTGYFNLTSFAFAFCLPFANSVQHRNRHSKLGLTVSTISIVSYSMYLLHLSLVLRVLYKLTDYNTSISTAIGFYALYLILTVLLSVLLYNFFERPMTNLRERKNPRN